MKVFKIGLLLGMVSSLTFCGVCEKKEEPPPSPIETAPTKDSGTSATPGASDAGKGSSLDGGKTTSLDGSVHIFDAAVIFIDASTVEEESIPESGPSDFNHG